MRSLLLFVAQAALATSLGCGGGIASPSSMMSEMAGSDAGEADAAETEDAGPVVVPDGGATWTALYTRTFGENGTASCSVMSACHANAGIGGGGFWVCGQNADECYHGMVGDIVPTGGATDATTTTLYKAIRRPDCATAGYNCNMPKMPSYVFAPEEVAAIVEWIQAGAPEN